MASMTWTSEQLLGMFKAALDMGPSSTRADLEFSVRIRNSEANCFGRFGLWLESDQENAARIDWILNLLQAPPEVRIARVQGTVRMGVAVSIATGTEFRLYLHGRDAQGGNTYTAYRWDSDATHRRCTYSFHYAPKGAAGERPEKLVLPCHHESASALAADPRFCNTSGFWLRADAEGYVDQVDFAFPWSPAAAELPGLGSLLEKLTKPVRAHIANLPVRHVAFSTAGGDAGVTLYCSSALDFAWPASERELQQRVCATATVRRQRTDVLIGQLTHNAGGSNCATSLDAFYGESIDHWQAVLGQEMHYHHGIFLPGDGVSATPEIMAAAMRRAVSDLYPFIPPGAHVYDLGCGWGGPMAMLSKERGCILLGQTISHTQFRHVAQLGFPVRWGDIEQTLPPRKFDCALMLESFEHIHDKQKLLRKLASFSGRLVMRVNCQDSAPEASAFAGTMQMVSSTELRRLIETSGWTIKHWRDRRNETMLSHEGWYRQLRRLPRAVVASNPHLQEFEAWCVRVLANRSLWAEHNPLIEVVADQDDCCDTSSNSDDEY
jgi:cyclopropane fatty-acyl-phospholipid synthase-like methyltransferase